ncbi:MAG: N-acetylmuramoyl-L-alanine amidase [Acidobacteriota bacterium]
MKNFPFARRRISGVFAAAVGAAALAIATPAFAQKAATAQYQRVLARETTARANAATPVATERAIARSYEAIVRAYPKSGFADNALWQGAGMLERAFERSKDKRDRDNATRLLLWLKKEYPTSAFAKRVDARLQTAGTPAATASTSESAPAAPPSAPAATRTSMPAPPSGPASVATPAVPRATAAVAMAPNAPASAPPDPTAPPATAAAPTAAAATSSATASQPAPRAPARVGGAPPAPPRPSGAAAAPVPPGPNAATLPPNDAIVSVVGITHATLPKGERVIIELNREAMYTASRADNPDRVIFDVLNAVALPGVAGEAGSAVGTLIKRVSVSSSSTGSLRLSLELNGKPRFSTFPLYNPFRLVIDIEADTSAAAFRLDLLRRIAENRAASATPGASPIPGLKVVTPSGPIDLPAVKPAPVAAATTASGDYSIARQLGLGISRIVIDPGHGGHDPGAQANGVTEAELVLDVSLRLERLLRDRPGIDVVMTRRTNEYIPLEQRTAIANRDSADLFLSIHANAGRDSARGVETYFLNMAVTPAAQLVAARENASSRKTMAVLPEILRTIALNNKLAESREFAATVQESIVRRLGNPTGAGRDLGVKQAPFEVLIGATMPSVLAEIAFITNKTDAALLKQATYRQRIAQALCDAVVKYQTSLKKVETVAARSEGG